MNWYIAVLKKYAVFSGRAQRAEFWYFALFSGIVSVVLSIMDFLISGGATGSSGILAGLYSLAIILPSLGVNVRRLHDTDRSGWWLLIVLVPLIGVIVLIVFYVQDSQASENRFGPNPKGGSDMNPETEPA